MKSSIGLIGAGFIGVAHANAIEAIISEKLVETEFHAVCDLNEERATTIAQSFGARIHCSDAEKLIRSGDINTVFICTPTKFHPELVELSVRAGLNIFCEKPLACSYAQVKQMQAAVLHSGVKNQVGLVLRYSPVYNVIRSLISDKKLGRPMSVIFRDDQYFPIQGIYGSTWRCEFETAGGGALIEHSIHDADILRWLLGDISSVRGIIRNFAGHRGIEDLASAQLEFASGCVGHLLSAWHNILRRESNRYMEIFFENGHISSADDFIGSIACQFSGGEIEEIPGAEVLRRYLDEVGLSDPRFNCLHSGQGIQDYHFLKALETGIKPYPDFGVAVKAHELVEAVYRAARNGADIKLPLKD
ncbi:MAG: gfo/Idh/MocA family oxidoreductase [Candidatus Abyssobacteria bacterium SURF_5]|uniref:Gfo/Idh/MocA family oxidoreductase n=1 Tax=Abyssobacteria bacterium (strain SURF_5) TaxID=2093360 RepID=A0A3A4N530_ABYX5|nr:MAG: gfo/Idh/MocA family oxidoreductase [Candidatus Abyssubacteria bacterium SURF_5]